MLANGQLRYGERRAFWTPILVDARSSQDFGEKTGITIFQAPTQADARCSAESRNGRTSRALQPPHLVDARVSTSTNAARKPEYFNTAPDRCEKSPRAAKGKGVPTMADANEEPISETTATDPGRCKIDHNDQIWFRDGRFRAPTLVDVTSLSTPRNGRGNGECSSRLWSMRDGPKRQDKRDVHSCETNPSSYSLLGPQNLGLYIPVYIHVRLIAIEIMD